MDGRRGDRLTQSLPFPYTTFEPQALGHVPTALTNILWTSTHIEQRTLRCKFVLLAAESAMVEGARTAPRQDVNMFKMLSFRRRPPPSREGGGGLASCESGGRPSARMARRRG